MRKAVIIALIMFVGLTSVSAIEYNSNTTIADSGSLSGNHTVMNNSTLEISGNYSIQDGTIFTVESGSKLIISGSMSATAPPQLNIDSQTSMLVPIGNLGPEGIMRIVFADPVYYNITIEINNTSQQWKGETFNFTGNMDVDNITVNITHCGCFGVIAISEIQLSPTGATPEIRTPEELTGNGTSYVIPTRTKSWTIDVHGDLDISGEVYGAEINCYGTCNLNDANLVSTGPINVYGSISVDNSSLSGGSSDEDIIVWDDAAIQWENSTGTGGSTDNWIRLLSTRTIGVQNSHVTFYGYNIGYSGFDTSPLSDNSTNDPASHGDHIIELGFNEWERLVEWQDGGGIHYTENASGKLVLATPWGTYEKEIADLPKVNHFDLEIDLPTLKFDSLVESDNENSVNSRLGVMATITNSGLASATFLVDCYSNGTEANVGVNVPYTAGAGETIEIPMNWDSTIEGEQTLDCSIFVPYMFYSIDVLDPDYANASTGIVTWEEVEDSSENLVLPISAGIVLAVLGYFGFVAIRRNLE